MARRKKTYFESHPAARRRLENYLAYGYLEINEYLRGPRQFAATHGPATAKRTGKDARALVRDLRAAQKRSARYCRAQIVGSGEALRALATRQIPAAAPMFVSRDATICSRVESTFAGEKGPGQEAMRLDVQGPAVDVSGIGRKRPGEALMTPGALAIERAHVDAQGTIRVRARPKKRAAPRRRR